MELLYGSPLILFTIAWLIGIWIASHIALPTIALGFAAGVALLGVILWRRARGPRWMFILALAAMLDALRYNLAPPHFDQTTLATRSANDQQKSVIVESIVGDPDTRDTYTNLRVEADHLLVSNLEGGVTRTVRGLVLIQN